MIYNYIFHFSEHRPIETRWACIHRDDEFYYWNGLNPIKQCSFKCNSDLRISYGKTPNEAAINLGLDMNK